MDLLINIRMSCLCLFFNLFQIPDAGKDPVLVALKGRAYLNKGQGDQALKVENFIYYENFMINKGKL